MKYFKTYSFLIVTLILLITGCKSKNELDKNNFYIKKQTWYESMYASCLNANSNINNPLIQSNWFFAGPFTTQIDSLFVCSFEPEIKSDITDKYLNKTISWIENIEWEDGINNEIAIENNVVYYLQRNINCQKDTNLMLYLGSDDGIKVWLNNNLILTQDVHRGCGPSDSVLINLKKGDNKIMLRINNFTGGFAFYYTFNRFNPENEIWAKLSEDFNSQQDLLEITWEKRHNIWHNFYLNSNLNFLVKRYIKAYQVSCQERGVEPEILDTNISTEQGLYKLRSVFLESKKKEYTILTPPAPKTPKINGPKIFGVRPGNPFHYKIPSTGEKPLQYITTNLPAGLAIDATNGIITGNLETKGEYKVKFIVSNTLGKDSIIFKIIVGDKIALTPPLGWNSWNCFGCAITENKIKAAADVMESSGLINYGWSYINIDDCWMKIPTSNDSILIDSSLYEKYSDIKKHSNGRLKYLKDFQEGLQGETRDSSGMILSNKDFPDMKSLTTYIHNKGLKAGIYISPGPLTCQCYIGSFMFEDKDAQQFANWGFDYLKYDWCGYNAVEKDRDLNDLKKPYIKMRQSLNKVKRDIVFSLCQYGWGDVWNWGEEVGGNCWRTTGDITDTWSSMSRIGFKQAGLEKFAKPGAWNDPDMLVVGWVGWGPSLRPTQLSANEQYTHISLWSLLNSPLLIGCDMTKLDDFTLNLLTNNEVLALNQDELGKQASRIILDKDIQVWVKDLADGSKAIGIFNLGESKQNYTLNLKTINFKGNCTIRDVWRQKDLGVFTNTYSTDVLRHGVVLIKIMNK